MSTDRPITESHRKPFRTCSCIRGRKALGLPQSIEFPVESASRPRAWHKWGPALAEVPVQTLDRGIQVAFLIPEVGTSPGSSRKLLNLSWNLGASWSKRFDSTV